MRALAAWRLFSQPIQFALPCFALLCFACLLSFDSVLRRPNLDVLCCVECRNGCCCLFCFGGNGDGRKAVRPKAQNPSPLCVSQRWQLSTGVGAGTAHLIDAILMLMLAPTFILSSLHSLAISLPTTAGSKAAA